MSALCTPHHVTIVTRVCDYIAHVPADTPLDGVADGSGVLPQVVSTGEGVPVTALHASLDGSMLAIQRSSAFLQFVHIRSSKMFVQVCHCC